MNVNAALTRICIVFSLMLLMMSGTATSATAQVEKDENNKKEEVEPVMEKETSVRAKEVTEKEAQIVLYERVVSELVKTFYIA